MWRWLEKLFEAGLEDGFFFFEECRCRCGEELEEGDRL